MKFNWPPCKCVVACMRSWGLSKNKIKIYERKIFSPRHWSSISEHSKISIFKCEAKENSFWPTEIEIILIHEADPQSQPVVIIVSAHVVRSSPLIKNHAKTISRLARLWVWPSGSLMKAVLFLLYSFSISISSTTSIESWHDRKNALWEFVIRITQFSITSRCFGYHIESMKHLKILLFSVNIKLNLSVSNDIFKINFIWEVWVPWTN